MPIRSSISDPDGKSVKEFNRLRREGPLPKSPTRKPSAAEREPLIAALQKLPINENMPKKVWIKNFSETYLRDTYTLWDIQFAVYPVSRTEHNDTKTCTGAIIIALTRNRRNVQPKLMLSGPYSKTWFREILDWIEDQFYGG